MDQNAGLLPLPRQYRPMGEVTELVAELAASVQAPPDQVSGQCCGAVRKLAERRLLTLAS